MLFSQEFEGFALFLETEDLVQVEGILIIENFLIQFQLIQLIPDLLILILNHSLIILKRFSDFCQLENSMVVALSFLNLNN
jgi:hypothetical protein